MDLYCRWIIDSSWVFFFSSSASSTWAWQQANSLITLEIWIFLAERKKSEQSENRKLSMNLNFFLKIKAETYNFSTFHPDMLSFWYNKLERSQIFHIFAIKLQHIIRRERIMFFLRANKLHAFLNWTYRLCYTSLCLLINAVCCRKAVHEFCSTGEQIKTQRTTVGRPPFR